MNYALLPKIELHLHLDCSLSYDVVKKINPLIPYDEFRKSFVAPPKCNDLTDYLTRAIRGFELMQTKEQLQWVTLDLMKQLKADQVIYAEIRFAPLLHIAKGLTPYEVVQTVNDALTVGIHQTGVEARLILCTLRHYYEEQSMETVKLVEQFRGSKVTGFDIAGDEAGYPIDAHKTAFLYAREKNIPVTAHAGEACGAGSIWETLKHFRPSRIGHGVRSAEDDRLLDFLKKENIHLEVCPTSNVQTNVVNTIRDHPADKIYRHGVSMNINTDGRTISDTTLTNEYGILENVFHWEKSHFLHCNLQAIEHAFCEAGLKKILAQKIMEAYNLP
jgi:adenosine deaminase